jgi:hypothetical protein
VVGILAWRLFEGQLTAGFFGLLIAGFIAYAWAIAPLNAVGQRVFRGQLIRMHFPRDFLA